MPFGFGKRSCPGQAVAELQMLLFTVHLLRWIGLCTQNNLTRYFRRCEVVVDKEKPLLNPKTETEWFSLFSRRPTYVLGGGLMLVENCNITVKERKNW